MISQKLTEHITETLKELGVAEPIVRLEHPADERFGDWSTNAALQNSAGTKQFKNPLEFAAALKENLTKKLEKTPEVEEITVAGPGFLNFRLSQQYWLKQLTVISETADITQLIPQVGAGKKAIVEYSSPNIAKPFTVGHLRSTLIGDALARLHEASGWQVFRDNHLGDWGTQFGKLIYAIETWGDVDAINQSERPIKELVRLYVKFHEAAETNSELENFGREWFRKLEEGDLRAKELWQWCVDLSWQEFDKIYAELGVTFTENSGRGYGEAFFENHMDQVIEILEETLPLEKAEQNGGYYGEGKGGAKLVFFNDESLPPLMILKQDGATLYSTRDLATDYFRLSYYQQPDLVVNEVGAEQSLYFRQLYRVEEMLGWYTPGQRVHVRHGLYRFKDTKMSTRKGNVIWLEDVIQEAKQRAQSLSKKSTVKSDPIAIGALKWNDLKSETTRDIIFDWNEILSMKGNSGPYVQYAAVRAKSLLKKVPKLATSKKKLAVTLNNEELALARHLDRFGEVVVQATQDFAPHHLALFLLELAQRFNVFYTQHPILTAQAAPIQQARLQLTRAVETVLTAGLLLLGIETPEAM